jgi:hypothetical protein
MASAQRLFHTHEEIKTMTSEVLRKLLVAGAAVAALSVAACQKPAATDANNAPAADATAPATNAMAPADANAANAADTNAMAPASNAMTPAANAPKP